MANSTYYLAVVPEDLQKWFNVSQRTSYYFMDKIRKKNKLEDKSIITRVHVAKTLKISLNELDFMIWTQELYPDILKYIQEKLKSLISSESGK